MTVFESPKSFCGLPFVFFAQESIEKPRIGRIGAREKVVLDETQHRRRALRAGIARRKRIRQKAVVGLAELTAAVGVLNDQLVAGGDPRDERALEGVRHLRLDVARLREDDGVDAGARRERRGRRGLRRHGPEVDALEDRRVDAAVAGADVK